MVFPFLAAYVLTQNPGGMSSTLILHDPAGKDTGIIEQVAGSLPHPQFSPKLFNGARWQFDYETVAFEKLIPGNNSYARFYVFSQERKEVNDPALSVTRMLERLWEYNYSNLHIDHSTVFGQGVVDVYLCKEGVAGGEQRFGEDSVNGQGRFKVDLIYIYDLATFQDPIEMAREVAHEYGHASLTTANGYSAPEDWASGYLGEKLFLKHIAEGMAAKQLEPADAMGATQAQIEGWLSKNVQPLVTKAAEKCPSLSALKLRDKEGMDNFIGLALYVDSVLPESVFSRSLTLMASNNAEDYLDAIVIAAQEPESYILKIPAYLSGKAIWIPLSDSKLVGAKILDRKDQWVKIQPQAAQVQVFPHH